MIALTPSRCPPSLLVLAAFLVVYTTACLYGSHYFYRDPGSIFFKQGRAFERYYSAYREAQAMEYVDYIKEGRISTTDAKAGENPRICMSILTAARDSSGPSLDKNVTKSGPADTPYLEVRRGSLFGDYVTS